MNINLATIDFCPSQGGGGEAVIRSLDVTENGTYRAPSGVDGYNPVSVSVSGGGSITPEEKAALDTLVDASNGVLYSKEYKKYVNYIENYYFNSSDWYERQSNINGDLYMIQPPYLFKFNKDTFTYDNILALSGSYSSYPLWMDKSGRMYMGQDTEIDLETGVCSSVSLNAVYYYYYRNRGNIYVGKYGVYIFYTDGCQKFNETTQQFEIWNNVNITSGYDITSTGTILALEGFEYDGHYVALYANYMFELKEYEDHIDIELVNNPYFPIDNKQNYGFVSCTNGLYYFYYQTKQKLVNGQWEDIVITNKNGYSGTYSFDFPGVAVDNLLLGYASQMYDSLKFKILNLDDDVTLTYWTDAKNIAVDLSSNQVILGTKRFNNNVTFSSDIGTNNIHNVDGGTLTISAPKMNIVGDIIKVNQDKFIQKNAYVATKNDIIANNTFVLYGPLSNNYGYLGNLYSEPYHCFTTNTNRTFFWGYNNEWTWNEWTGGSSFSPVSFSISFEIVEKDMYNKQIVVTPTDTVLCTNDKTYLWDDANTDWIEICDVGLSGLWWDGNAVRALGAYKLVYDSGNDVWSWDDSDIIQNYMYGQYHTANGNIYVISSDYHLYQYDYTTKTYTKLGYTNFVPSSSYSYFDEIFVVQNNTNYSVYRIDFTKVDPNNPDESLIGEYLFDSNNKYIWPGDNLYYISNNEVCSSYDIISEVPEVPASNGTYTLQATRVGDQITYEWVSNVI